MAFGSVIAMSCDYRVMADDDRFKTDLQAVHLVNTLVSIKKRFFANVCKIKGITPCFWFKDTMLNTIGHRECEKTLEIGRVYKPKEALRIGLVDELASSNELISLAEKHINMWCRIPSKTNCAIICSQIT